METPSNMERASFVISRAYQKSKYVSVHLPRIAVKMRLEAYIHKRNNIAEMGLSFKKSLCLKLHTKNIFKVDNAVNNPLFFFFLYINSSNMLQFLSAALYPTICTINLIL